MARHNEGRPQGSSERQRDIICLRAAFGVCREKKHWVKERGRGTKGREVGRGRAEREVNFKRVLQEVHGKTCVMEDTFHGLPICLHTYQVIFWCDFHESSEIPSSILHILYHNDLSNNLHPLARHLKIWFVKKKVCLLERQSYTERQIFHLLVNSADGNNEHHWADPKPGAKSSFWVSYEGARVPGPKPSSTALSAFKQGVEAARTPTSAHMQC